MMFFVVFGVNNFIFMGVINGDVYVWKDYFFIWLVVKVYIGFVFIMYIIFWDGFIVIGGKEWLIKEGGVVKLWD